MSGLPPAAFTPESVPEFFALHLARVLGDEANLRLYLDLVREYPLANLLDVYYRAAASDCSGRELRERFWSFLYSESERRFVP